MRWNGGSSPTCFRVVSEKSFSCSRHFYFDLARNGGGGRGMGRWRSSETCSTEGIFFRRDFGSWYELRSDFPFPSRVMTKSRPNEYKGEYGSTWPPKIVMPGLALSCELIDVSVPGQVTMTKGRRNEYKGDLRGTCPPKIVMPGLCMSCESMSRSGLVSAPSGNDEGKAFSVLEARVRY